MKRSIANKLALKNIKANKVLFLPYILSGIFMLSLFYVMTSLSDNTFVQTRHASLRMVVSFGVIVVSIFITIFMIYINRFIHKKRMKEFGLYSVLGLEKKHIANIIFHEQLYIYLIVLAFASLVGFGFGKLAMLAIGHILNDLDPSILKYSFSLHAFNSTLIIWTAISVVVFFIQTSSIIRYNPKELFEKEKSKETTPVMKWLYSLIGFASLGYGYYLAVTSSGSLESLTNFFIAVLFVILGTYLLFVFFMNNLFNRLQKNKKFYYKKKNFLWITGMQKRINSNSVGLATIAILCTCVLVAVSTTTTIYQQIDDLTQNSYPKDFELSTRFGYDANEDLDFFNSKKDEMKELILANPSYKGEVKDLSVGITTFVSAIKSGETLNPLERNVKPSRRNIPCFVHISTIDSYNSLYNKNITLGKDELLVSSNSENFLKINSLNIDDKTYNITKVDEIPNGKFGVEMYFLTVDSFETLQKFANYFKSLDFSTKEMVPSAINVTADWTLSNPANLEGYGNEFKNYVSTFEHPTHYDFNSKLETAHLVVDLNGGFLMVGYLAGAIFLAGCILITYYKQIFEGYEDRKSFEIMKKVGLPDELIRATASKQIVWMFFIPLAVALIHTLVASVILTKLLLVFGVVHHATFYKTLGIITLIFGVIYLFVFKLTSNVYYNIVDAEA